MTIFKLTKCWLLAFCLLLTACATSLDNTDRIQSATLTLGETSKGQASNLLGFPQFRQLDQESLVETWAYMAKSQLAGLYFGVPISETTAIMHDISYDPAAPEFADAALILEFDASGILRHINKTHEDKK